MATKNLLSFVAYSGKYYKKLGFARYVLWGVYIFKLLRMKIKIISTHYTNKYFKK